MSSSLSYLLRSTARNAGVRHFSIRTAYTTKAQTDGFLPDACQIQCLTRLSDIHAALQASKPSQSSERVKGLYIYGGVGTGKTMMLDLFHKEVKASGVSCDRRHFHEFLQGVHLRLHRLRKRIGSQPRLLRLCAEEYKDEFPVLAFDEAHVLNVGDALMLRTFFEAYFDAGGVLVATSNVAPDDLYASGINREVFMPFLDALRERCEFFEMQGRHDYRQRAAQAGLLRGIYRQADVPVNDLSPGNFEYLRKTLGIPEQTSFSSHGVDIDVGFGRTLRCETSWSATVGKATRRVVHFNLDELCRTATGPSEWVGIAEYADAVMVSQVPQFPAHDEDVARRFMTFVDIIYDKQVFLVVTAKASPDGIFAELIEKYGGDTISMAPLMAKTEDEENGPPYANGMKMPGHGLGSGRHGVVFQKPKGLQYGVSGGYSKAATDTEDVDAPVKRNTSVARTGGRAEHGLGSGDRVMTGVVEEDSDWVEWSATGLKDASLFDLSPTNTHTQVNDKLLPFRRCASRLHQMEQSGTVPWAGHPETGTALSARA